MTPNLTTDMAKYLFKFPRENWQVDEPRTREERERRARFGRKIRRVMARFNAMEPDETTPPYAG